MPRDNDLDISIPGYYAMTATGRYTTADLVEEHVWGGYDGLPAAKPVHAVFVDEVVPYGNVDYTMFRDLLRQFKSAANAGKVYAEGTVIDDETGLPL